MKNIIKFLLAISISIGLVGCGQQSQVKVNTVQNTSTTNQVTDTSNKIIINIKNFNFYPKEITVKVGTTITWTNEDSTPHTTTSTDNFDSKSLAKGESFSFTFDKAGTFDYICTFHPSMKGRIIVN